MSGPSSVLESDFDPFAGPQILATAPSTEAQREIWTAALMGDDASLAYNESVTLLMRGEVDITRLQQSFQALVQRHEALRTTLSGDGLTLCFGDAQAEPADVRDLTELSPEAQRTARQELLDEELSTPFDLEQGPLFRVRYLRLGPGALDVVLTAHHIVCDGWSTAVLLKEWAAIYNAGEIAAAGLPAAPQLSQYSRAAIDFREADAHAESERYWLEQFRGELPVLDLPCDRPRPPHRTYGSRRYDMELGAELLTAAKKASAAARASLFTTLLASFKALLHRLSGQQDLVVGIPAAGQNTEGFEGLVGHCVNMLPLRSQLDAATPMLRLVGSVGPALLDAFDHQRYTFGTLLSKLPTSRDPSRSPLVSVVFNLDRGLTSEAIGFRGIETTCLTNPRQSENFDLFLNVVELPSGLRLECQYNTSLLDEATVRRWLEAYERVLRAFTEDPNIPLESLPVVSADERALFDDWNAATQSPVPQPQLVHRLIEQTCSDKAEEAACVFEARTLSYAELNLQANQLARRLRGLGVKRGDIVGVCLERSHELLVALLGILKAGAAYLPLDPAYPLERLRFMTEDADIAGLVTQRSVLSDLPLTAQWVIDLDGDADLSREVGTDLPDGPQDASPADPAYVIYTSGSTGKPKGVLLAHRSVANLMRSVSKRPGMTAADRVLAVTTFAFDISVSELLLPLTVGAQVVLASREVAADGARLLDLVRSARVTFIDATPATYRLLLAAGWTGDPNLTAICTGEAMPRDLAIQLAERVKALWNGYGPTETTIWSTFYQVTPPVGRILIGRPVDNTQIYLLDERGEPTPLGVPGEVYIGGQGVAIGYLNRPELTQERFVDNPFDREPGARMYRTGDLARYLPDGNLECLGRSDTQVKLRGYRIELGEIEDALGRHAAVRQAAVVVREDTPGDARLTAYVVTAGDGRVRDAELREHLKRTLPDYMVPAAYVRLETMPLTPSGKVNRRALPAPDADAGIDAETLVPPSSPTEELLATLFQEALNVARVGVHDDFFALGGHSLLASQILARLRRDHQIQLSFRKMFEAPTIARLAEAIEQSTRDEQPSQSIPLVRAEDQSSAPLSVVQERLWMLEQLGESRALVHNLPAAWRLRGAVQLPLLQRSLDAIVARHATLRTTVRLIDGHPRQVVSPSATLPILEIDLTGEPAETREDAMLKSIARCTREPFDLAALPLFRSVLYRLAPEECVYFTVRHNAIWDGWSFDIFLRELATCYTAFAAGDEPTLPELPVQYGDFARYQRPFLDSAEIARQTTWWREQLAGTPPELALPADRPRPVNATFAGDNYTIHLSRSEAEALTEIGRAAGATLFMVLMAAYNVLLFRFSNQTEVLVGTPFRARGRPELENLLGPFVNTLMVRTRLTPSQTFTELLGQVRDTTLDCLGHEDMPLEKLGTQPPVVRALFSYQDARARPPALGDIAVEQVHVEPPAAANDVMLWTMETRDALLAVMNYSTELFDPATARALLDGYAALLRGVLANPETSLADLPLVAASDVERAQQLGQPTAPERAAGSLRELLDAQATARGADPAIEEGVERLTYADLRTRALATASALLREDATADANVVVAVLAPGAIDRITLLLGVVLAGKTALLLDPGAPVGSHRALCEAADARALLLPKGVTAPPDLAQPTLEVAPDAEPGDATSAPGSILAYAFDARSRPALVSITHAAWLFGSAALAQELEISASERVVSALGPSSPTAVHKALAALCAGATWVATHDELAAPTSADILIASSSQLARVRSQELSQPRLIAIEGAPTPELAARLASGGARALLRLDARVGPSVLLFAQRIASPHHAKRLGRPLYPARIAVLDHAGRDAGVGVPGELAYASEHCETKPTWATRRFGQRDLPCLASGTRARLLADGSVDLLWTPEAQVEHRGIWFSLEEVEQVLLQHPSVISAACVLRVSKSGLPKLCAFLVAATDRPFIESELRSHARAHLPEHAVPQSFDEVDDLPRRPDGTANRAELLRRAQQESERAFTPPRTDMERLLAEIWQEALGVTRIGVHDNFFDLGGHSLLCFKVITTIQQSTGQRIGPRILFLGSLEQVASELSATSAPVAQAETQAVATESSRREQGQAPGLFRRLKRFVRG